MARVAVGEEILTEAAEGHIQRVGFTVESIQAVMVDLDISPDEASHAIASLGDVREWGGLAISKDDYRAAALDGFILGARAVRLAEARAS
jgi:hypothetical protein